MEEKDPNGIAQHDLGCKLDAGKPMAGYVLGDFSNAIMEVCKVGTFGATKYARDSWKYVPDGESRYEDAAMRHWLYMKQGEFKDADSGLDHLAHQIWNLLAQYELQLKRKDVRGSVDGVSDYSRQAYVSPFRSGFNVPSGTMDHYE